MDFIKSIIGEQTIGQYMAFCLFALAGMFWIKLARYNIKKKALLRAEPPKVLKFNRGIWLNDNLLDFVLTFISAFLIFRFFPDAFSFISKFETVPEFTDKMIYGLLLGLFFQYLLHKAMNSVKVNIV